ncbi:Crp/Fnr family transcriptional regulator [Levilactobacillus bambusae]|uniref:Crp/Fnr family transcriptional regulator n=1 Tax=Levilactobacillus bambusae TaxID=2024736 RepID=A0A2V1N2H1_9LACO|nr:Crp/Fnr family transcriptional regulator [Levilactobacillus bambusae]PWG00456.1 Crp/Fnr family transcriptional regulator [Levilactobacillus bambusae]
MDIATKEDLISTAMDQYHVTISDLDVHRLAVIAEQAYFPHGSLVLNTHQPQQSVYLIIDGIARSFYIDQNGRNVTKNFMVAGEFLIGESLFADTSTEAFDAVEDCQCLRFNAAKMKAIILGSAPLTQFYIGQLEATLRYKMQREYAFQSLSAQQRYEEFQKQFGAVEKRIPQNQIASYIGITKESLSRIRKKMMSC